MKATITLRHIVWRDARPRFEPGPKLRALGFKGEDLRHAGVKGPKTGPWYTLREAEDWSTAKADEIAAARARKAAGKRALPPSKAGRQQYTIETLFEDFWASKTFRSTLAPRTQADYRHKAKCFADFDPLIYATPAREVTRHLALGWHEAIWEERGHAMANGMLAVLRLAYSHAIDRGFDGGRIAVNPCAKLKLPTPKERIRVATIAEFNTLLKTADEVEPAIGDAIFLALCTGQRQADILSLVDAGVVEGRVVLRQAKTGARVSIPATADLLTRLAAMKDRRATLLGNLTDMTAKMPLILHPDTRRPYELTTFRHRFADVRACAAADCATLTGQGTLPDGTAAKTLWFSDLRDTAVTWLARAGATVPEIAAITGHSIKTVHTILKHYLALDTQLADAAIAKLEAYMKREGVQV